MSYSGKTNFSATIANTTNSVGVSINAQLGVIGNVSKGFKFYRFRKLDLAIDPVVRFESSVPDTGVAGSWALAYVPELTTATLTTLTPTTLKTLDDNVAGQAQVVNSNITNNSALSAGYPGVLLIAGDTVQRHLRVKPKSLREGIFPMYLCAGTPGVEVTQGQLIFAVEDSAGVNTVVFRSVLSYTVDFWECEDNTVLGLVPRTLFLRPLTDDAAALSVVDDKEDSERKEPFVMIAKALALQARLEKTEKK